jgi:ABC-type bacteriocin/lantibiotic exporter with double-glycine peptidase domain
MNQKQDKYLIEKSAIVVTVILGMCMFTITMALIDRVEWNFFLTVVTALPIISLPYLHSRLEQRKRQFEEDMRIGLKQFEENLKRK